MTKYLLRLIVENQRGVMARIATLLARKGYNIKSICVARHLVEDEASIMLTIEGSNDIVEQAKNQLDKLVNVIKSDYFEESKIVERELALFKVEKKPGVKENMEKHGARLLEKNGRLLFEFVGSPGEVDSFLEKIRKDFRLIDVSRSGTNAMDF